MEHHRCEKHFMYDPAVRIPYLLCWPGQLPAGTTVDALASQIDMFPTVLGLVGAPPPAIAGGDHAAELLAGTLAGPEFVFAENYDVPGGYAWTAMARSHRGKLVVLAPRDRTQAFEYAFYDLARDPYELENRIDDPACAGEIASHKDAFCQWMVETRRHMR